MAIVANGFFYQAGVQLFGVAGAEFAEFVGLADQVAGACA